MAEIAVGDPAMAPRREPQEPRRRRRQGPRKKHSSVAAVATHKAYVYQPYHPSLEGKADLDVVHPLVPPVVKQYDHFGLPSAAFVWQQTIVAHHHNLEDIRTRDAIISERPDPARDIKDPTRTVDFRNNRGRAIDVENRAIVVRLATIKGVIQSARGMVAGDLKRRRHMKYLHLLPSSSSVRHPVHDESGTCDSHPREVVEEALRVRERSWDTRLPPPSKIVSSIRPMAISELTAVVGCGGGTASAIPSSKGELVHSRAPSTSRSRGEPASTITSPVIGVRVDEHTSALTSKGGNSSATAAVPAARRVVNPSIPLGFGPPPRASLIDARKGVPHLPVFPAPPREPLHRNRRPLHHHDTDDETSHAQ